VTDSSRATPLNFALGSLTERVQTLSEEQQRSRLTAEAMPQKIVDLISPRLIEIQVQQKDHGRRLVTLERDRWKLIGGFTVLFVIGGIVIGHPLK
jgi:hypothetical protein